LTCSLGFAKGVGLVGLAWPERDDAAESELSRVLALRSGGALGDCGEAFCGCQRSSTDAFFDGAGAVAGLLLSGVFAVLEFVLDADSSSLLSFTRLCTNPRPCRRLRLGVRSFGAGGRRKAGDALLDADAKVDPGPTTDGGVRV